jgi:plasmid stabilization system protein ParE
VKPALFHSEARAEVREAAAYYAGKRRGLGKEFRAEVEAAVERIRKNPKAFTPYGNEGLRKCVLDRFPYNIYFQELDDAIWVAAVAHQRRQPDYWAGRTPG